MKLTKIMYPSLNARQKENFNFQKLSGVLADYGYATMRLNDDWQGADFIAQHVTDGTFLKVQLKSRLSFYKKYHDKDLYIAFRDGDDWYLYPHDELVAKVKASGGLDGTDSWDEHGGYSYPTLSRAILPLLAPYKL